MGALQKTLFIIALLTLLTQIVRHLYFKQSPSDRRLHNGAHLKSRAGRNAVDLNLILIKIEFDRLIAA
jgi:hypothetical protein